MALPAVAEALLLTKESIHDHITEYKNSKKPRPENGGSSEKFSFSQSKQLEAHLEDHTYLYVKDIVTYVKSTWSISYTVHVMRNRLARHGFSYKNQLLFQEKQTKKNKKHG